MENYIDVETVRVIAHDYLCVQREEDAFMSEIDEAATSDVAPVRHGTYEHTHRPDMLKCSVCCGAGFLSDLRRGCPDL